MLPPGAVVLGGPYHESMLRSADEDTVAGSAADAPASPQGLKRRGAAAAAEKKVAAAGALDFVVICGLPILSNEAVNLASSAATGALTAWAGMALFRAAAA